ncbi:uncharacterized protein [Henckelia pumila]|uniref:uncharacterized protein n=1 Tax=Henckelia pumila TaxID=405737 RepID=UPI003C6E2BD4
MYNDLRNRFWWKMMKADVTRFASKYLNCQQVKAERKRRDGLLHSLAVPEWKWDHITMDFVTKLPRSSRGCDAIWVVVDRLTKSACFMPYEITYKPDEAPVIGPDMIKEMTENVKLIQSRMRTISPFRGTVRFGKRDKLSPRYIGSYKIIDKVGDLAYRLALPPALSSIHDVFHVSMLSKYQPDPSYVLQPNEAELYETLSYFERPIQILDRKDKQLRDKSIQLVKVQWSRHGVEEATWELEQDMRQRYPELFV